MSDYIRPPGKTTVSPGVLMTIARMAALGVPGVSSVGRPSSARERALGGRIPGGVRLDIQDEMIRGDMFVTIRAGVNVREVCREVQEQVSRALHEMAGMIVTRLEIHVEDIHYDAAEA